MKKKEKMNPTVLKRIKEALEDTKLYVLRNQNSLPQHLVDEIEKAHEAIRGGDMTIRNPSLGDYFQAADTHNKWWVSTEVEGIVVRVMKETPMSRISIIRQLFEDKP